jgi:hypothetical protein
MWIPGYGMEKIRIREFGWKKLDPGSGIRDKHPRSATLISTITHKVTVYTPSERTYTLPLCLLYPSISTL